MLIGLPGSGKSTWVNYQVDHADAQEDLYIASTDDYLERIAAEQGKTYNDVFADNIKAAEKHMYVQLALATDLGHDIIWDQTNLNRKSRAKKLIMIPDHYEKIAIYFPMPDNLQERLDGRKGKTIPEHVMNNMVMSIEKPEKDEGFDMIMEWSEDLYYV